MTDDVLLGVRQAREAFAASHGYDLRAMAVALRKMDAADDWPVVRRPPRRPEVIDVPEQRGGCPAVLSPDQPPQLAPARGGGGN